MQWIYCNRYLVKILLLLLCLLLILLTVITFQSCTQNIPRCHQIEWRAAQQTKILISYISILTSSQNSTWFTITMDEKTTKANSLNKIRTPMAKETQFHYDVSSFFFLSIYWLNNYLQYEFQNKDPLSSKKNNEHNS